MRFRVRTEQIVPDAETKATISLAKQSVQRQEQGFGTYVVESPGHFPSFWRIVRK